MNTNGKKSRNRPTKLKMAEARKIALVAGSILLAAALILGGQFLIRERSRKQVSVIVPELSAEAKNGKVAFETHCVQCHGANASGSDRGPSLIDRIYESMHHGDFSFVRAVTLGVPQHHWLFGSMPAQPQVTRQEIDPIIVYIRELQKANGIQ